MDPAPGASAVYARGRKHRQPGVSRFGRHRHRWHAVGVGGRVGADISLTRGSSGTRRTVRRFGRAGRRHQYAQPNRRERAGGAGRLGTVDQSQHHREHGSAWGGHRTPRALTVSADSDENPARSSCAGWIGAAAAGAVAVNTIETTTGAIVQNGPAPALNQTYDPRPGSVQPGRRPERDDFAMTPHPSTRYWQRGGRRAAGTRSGRRCHPQPTVAAVIRRVSWRQPGTRPSAARPRSITVRRRVRDRRLLGRPGAVRCRARADMMARRTRSSTAPVGTASARRWITACTPRPCATLNWQNTAPIPVCAGRGRTGRRPDRRPRPALSPAATASPAFVDDAAAEIVPDAAGRHHHRIDGLCQPETDHWQRGRRAAIGTDGVGSVHEPPRLTSATTASPGGRNISTTRATPKAAARATRNVRRDSRVHALTPTSPLSTSQRHHGTLEGQFGHPRCTERDC